MNSFRWLLLVFLSISFQSNTQAQCCAAGNPISGDGSAGGTGKNIFEASLYYQHSYSDTYFNGTNKSDYKYIDYSFYNFTSLRLAYGVSNKVKLSAELGYFFSKAQAFDFGFDRNAHGIGDLVLGIQYFAYRNPIRKIDIFPSFDLTLPVGNFDQMDGVVILPIDLQPSSGSFKYKVGLLVSKRYMQDKLAFFLSGSAEISQRINTDRTNYKYGNLYHLSLYGSYKIFRRLTGAVQIRGQIRDKASDSNKETLQSTGGKYVFIAPQLRYNFWRSWNLSAAFDYPIYKNTNGNQLTNKYAFSFRLSKTFNFSKAKVKPIDLDTN
jgi:hypothetical protein